MCEGMCVVLCVHVLTTLKTSAPDKSYEGLAGL